MRACGECKRLRAGLRSAQRDYANIIAILQQLLPLLPHDDALAIKLREAHARMTRGVHEES